MPREDTQFQIGNPGGPGRPIGSRNKLSERFLAKLAKDFKQHGSEVIQEVRERYPDRYMSIVATLIPKEFQLDIKAEGARWVISAEPEALEDWAASNNVTINGESVRLESPVDAKTD